MKRRTERVCARLCVASALLALLPLAVAACGGGDTSSPSTAASPDAGDQGSATPEMSVDQAEAGGSYDGVEADLPTSYQRPVKKPNVNFKVGFLQIIESIPQLATLEHGAKQATAELGGEFISVDAELDIQKQVAGFEQLLAQGVDMIVGYPVVSKALAPQLAKAEAAGIPVVTTGAQPDPSKPVPDKILSDVNEALDYEAWVSMKALADEHPGVNFVTMGLALPVESLEYAVHRYQYWGEQFGLEFAGEIDSKEDNPEGYSAAATAILGKYPDAQAVVTYNELAALSTSTVAKAQNRTGLLVLGQSGGSQEAIDAVGAGTLFSTYAVPWNRSGREIVFAAYSALTHQNLPLPPKVTARGTLVTAATAGEAEATVEE